MVRYLVSINGKLHIRNKKTEKTLYRFHVSRGEDPWEKLVKDNVLFWSDREDKFNDFLSSGWNLTEKFLDALWVNKRIKMVEEED